jgi:hypothetical protein
MKVRLIDAENDSIFECHPNSFEVRPLYQIDKHISIRICCETEIVYVCTLEFEQIKQLLTDDTSK